MTINFDCNKDLLYQGQFSNGLTYYIQENPYDIKKASLRLVVKAGSVVEEEDERGLAHFIEHLLFKGSKSYADGEVIAYLESIGAAFGADTNAYTGCDETVYLFDIPLENKDSLKKALHILSEFALEASFSQSAIDKERGVVLDEIRMYKSQSQGRIGMKMMEFLLEGTSYENRHPLGLEKVVENASPSQLYDFYKKWYTLDRMALIVVGDFNAKDTFENVKELFGSLTSKKAHPLKELQITPLQDHSVKVYQDPESLFSTILLMSWMDLDPVTTEKDLRKKVLEELTLVTASRRLEDQTKRSDPPFQNPFTQLGQLIRNKRSLMHNTMCWDKEPARSIEELIKEISRFEHLSFSDQEFDLACKKLKVRYDNVLENSLKQRNYEYVAVYMDHFLNQEMLMPLRDKTQAKLKMLETLSKDDLVLMQKKLFNQHNYLVIYMPSSQCEKIEESKILEWMHFYKNQIPNQISDKKIAHIDLQSESEKGDILSCENVASGAVKKLQLSNGMMVYLEKSNLKEKLFSARLFALGGSASFSQEDYPSASVCFSYLNRLGLAGLSQNELSDALVGETLQMNYAMDFVKRMVRVTGSQDSTQTLFKLLQSLFMNRESSESTWKECMKKIDQMYDLVDKNPEMKFMQLINQLNYQNHYFFDFYNSERMSQEKAEKALDSLLGDPSDFTLVLCGDYHEEKIMDALKTYLASIPKKLGEKRQIKQTPQFPKGIEHRIYDEAGIGNEVSFVLTIPMKVDSLDQNYETFIQFSLIETILLRRLLKKLRNETGETYNVSVYSSAPFYPRFDLMQLCIQFSTASQHVEKLKEELFKEITQVIEKGIKEEELEEAKEIYRHKQAKLLQSNEGHTDRLLVHLLFEKDLFISEQELLKSIDSEILEKSLKRFIQLDNYTTYTKIPKSS